METEIVVDLEQYKTTPLKARPDELAGINRKLEELARDCFEIETEAKRMLLHQKALYTYPKLDTSFLSLSAEREWEYLRDGEKQKTSIRVPRFSVHKLDEPDMVINVGHWWGNFYKAYVVSPENLPNSIVVPLLKTVEFFNEDCLREQGNGEKYLFVKKYLFGPKVKALKEIFKKYKKIWGMVEIQRSFSGLIPTENKKTIKEAQKIFGDEIFLIAEAKPEDWNVKKYIADPIVAGVIRGDLFYIDKFNTTSLEDYVKTGFTQTN